MGIAPPDWDKSNPDDNVVSNNCRIAITLNISLSINGVKYDLDGCKDDASENTNNEDESEGEEGSDKATKLCVRIYTKANPRLCLTIRDGKVFMAESNPSDSSQIWFKYEKYSIDLKDPEGYPSFVLVNKATGQAIMHSGHDEDVQLIPFNLNNIDKSVLWTCKVMDGSYMYIRNFNDISLLLDAWNGNGDGIYHGTKIIQWKFVTGHNQLWKIVPC